jgi:2TM domain
MSSELREYETSAHPAPPEDDSRYRAARQKAEARQGLYIHTTVYLLVNLSLFLVNLVTHSQGGGWWFFWPAIWWGVLLAIHAATVVFGVFSPEWKDREAERILERERRKAA